MDRSSVSRRGGRKRKKRRREVEGGNDGRMGGGKGWEVRGGWMNAMKGRKQIVCRDNAIIEVNCYCWQSAKKCYSK